MNEFIYYETHFIVPDVLDVPDDLDVLSVMDVMGVKVVTMRMMYLMYLMNLMYFKVRREASGEKSLNPDRELVTRADDDRW